MAENQKSNLGHQDIEVRTLNGLAVLLSAAVLTALGIAGFIAEVNSGLSPIGMMSVVILFVIVPILLYGLKIVRPNEALVFTKFGKYCGTLKGEGIYFVSIFASAVAPASNGRTVGELSAKDELLASSQPGKKISLKARTLINGKQTINDAAGNPVEVGMVVIWRVADAAKAVFDVDDFAEYLRLQCNSALRGIVRQYPYDSMTDGERSLRGSGSEIARLLKADIQSKADAAGLEILDARITHLSYATEIAAAMLQRQQAAAVIDARNLIVEGAAGMVETALAQLREKNVVELNEERKAAMVNALMVVLCGNRDVRGGAGE